ncbi:MAG: hypothetical protein D6712_19240 [Chloroflexi bacterium]|nr:MAG: hypothetical protein D6712_19240 [Chloroflexota bacterium]
MRIVTLCLGLALLTVSALAELYIYSDEQRVRPPKAAQSQQLTLASREWYSPISRPMPFLTNGQCELVAVVANQLKPSSEWLVRVDDELDKACITWSSVYDEWYEILRAIDATNPHARIWINHDEKVIAWSSDIEALPYLAHRTPRVWTLDPRRSLRENLMQWAKIVRWQLVWDVPFDAPVKAKSRFFALHPFRAIDGEPSSLEQVLMLAASDDLALKADIDVKNRIVRISKRLYRVGEFSLRDDDEVAL